MARIGAEVSIGDFEEEAAIARASQTGRAPTRRSGLCRHPFPANALTGDMLGQVGYWTAGGLQHDAALAYAVKRVHASDVLNRLDHARFNHPRDPTTVRDVPFVATSFSLDLT